MKCPTEPDLLPLLLSDSLPLLPPDLPLLSSVGGGRRRVGGGGREGGAKERGRAKASWIGGELDRGQAGSTATSGCDATVRKRVREREECVREL